MNYYSLDERIIAEGQYIVETSGTVRSTAKKFGISKSTVHKDLAVKLYYINERLYHEVKKLLGDNLSVRHIRGGNATKIKYQNIKKSSPERSEEKI